MVCLDLDRVEMETIGLVVIVAGFEVAAGFDTWVVIVGDVIGVGIGIGIVGVVIGVVIGTWVGTVEIQRDQIFFFPSFF